MDRKDDFFLINQQLFLYILVFKWTVSTFIPTTIASFQMIFFCKNNEAIISKVVIFFF